MFKFVQRADVKANSDDWTAVVTVINELPTHGKRLSKHCEFFVQVIFDKGRVGTDFCFDYFLSYVFMKYQFKNGTDLGKPARCPSQSLRSRPDLPLIAI
jgi:hypothetical protein